MFVNQKYCIIYFFLFKHTFITILNKKKRSKEYFLQTSCSFSQTFNSFNCVNVSVIVLLLFVTNGLGFRFRKLKTYQLLATQTYITKTKVQFYNYSIIVTKKI